MKSIYYAVALLCFLVAGIVYLHERNSPQFEWGNLFDSTMPIDSGGFNTVAIENSQKVRFELEAPQPVTVQLLRGQPDAGNLAYINPAELNCFVGQTTDAKKECEVPGNAYLVITYNGHQRSQIIKLTIDVRHCVENCSTTLKR